MQFVQIGNSKSDALRQICGVPQGSILGPLSGADPGEVKRVNFHPPFSEPPSFFFFLIPQILIGSNTLLQKFTPHFKILDPRLYMFCAT